MNRRPLLARKLPPLAAFFCLLMLHPAAAWTSQPADASVDTAPAEATASPEQGQASEPELERSPRPEFLAPAARQVLRSLLIQDFQGRMKPLDTLSREMVMKITKRSRFEDWEPLDLYLSWIVDADYWFREPLIAVRHPQLKKLLGVDEDTGHVSAASLLDERGKYRLGEDVEKALRTPDRERSKFQRKLLSFDERANLFFMNMQQGTLRIYPLPDDAKHSWLTIADLAAQVDEERRGEFLAANEQLLAALGGRDPARILAAARAHAALQARYGAAVMISGTALSAELLLNRFDPFKRITLLYMLAMLLLIPAYVWTLARRGGRGYSLRQPFYLLGSAIYWLALLLHLSAFVLRWVASGRAPLSNGYESLIWIGLMVGVAGLLFELVQRKGLAAGQAALLSTIILGVSLLSTFNPAIGPLVPVLSSYWLIIHVTVITASYAFLGVATMTAMAILILHLFKGPGRDTLRAAVRELHGLHWWMLVSGLGLLSLGTLLGGVWANESWGRYWGWDAKETWSLVTILVYALVTHMRFVSGLNRPWPMAAGSFAAVSSVVMTYFGVNYLLGGLHSYAAGEATRVPGWVFAWAAIMVLLLLSSLWRERSRSWEESSAP